MEELNKLFPKQNKVETKFTSMHILEIFKDCELTESSCIKWNKKTGYKKLFNKQKHVRQIIYEYCVGTISDGFNIIQTCDSQYICLCFEHLKQIKNGTVKKKKEYSFAPYTPKKIKELPDMDSDLESNCSDILMPEDSDDF